MTRKVGDVLAIATTISAMQIGIDLSIGPHRYGYWQPPKAAKVPDPKKRAKVKAARKQKKGTP